MGIRHILTAYLFLFSVNAFAQNKVQWQKLEVDENLIAMFPSDIEKIDTVLYKDNTGLKFKGFKSKTSNSNFGITVTPEGTNIRVDNLEALDEAYKGIETGFRNNAASKEMSCNFSDTIIDKVIGRKVVMYRGTTENPPLAIFYLFLLNDKLYEITCIPINGGDMGIADMNRLLTGLDFTAVNISEKRFTSKVESQEYKIGELIGEIIGFLFIIGLIVGIIIYITKKK